MSGGTPLSHFPKYPITSGISLIAIGLFLFVDEHTAELITADVRAFESEPWRLFTSVLLHGGTLQTNPTAGLIHMGFNLYWIWHVGTLLEAGIGHVRMAALVLLTGVAGTVLEYAITGTSVGLSGVVYGLVGMLWVLNREDPRYRGMLNPKVIQFLAFWFVLCVALTLTDTVGIANGAHGAGALVGVLYGLLYTRRGMPRMLVAFGLTALLTLFAAGATFLRPAVNFSTRAGLDQFQLGTRALERGDFDEAQTRLRKATIYRRTDPEIRTAAWFNLGLAHLRQGEVEEASEAFEEARALQPDDPQIKRQLLQLEMQEMVSGSAGTATSDSAPEDAIQ